MKISILSKTRRARSRAFTLIELLVVIAVIAILAALLSSALGTGSAAAKKTQCASNMRQIGIGLSLYCNDHGGDFPQTMHTTEEEHEAWVWLLKPYLANVDEIRICAADQKAEERRVAKGTSYVLNEYIAVPLTNSFGEVRESLTNRLRLDRPAQTILLFIGADSLDIGVSADHTHSRNWRDWPRVLHDIQPDRHRAGAASEDHTRGSANYLFGDGHVEGIEAAVVKRLIDNLEPFARPPE